MKKLCNIFVPETKGIMEKSKFEIKYSAEVIDFLKSLDEKSRYKVYYNIEKGKYGLDPEVFKKLKGCDIWEFRTLYKGKQYRILAFWTDGALVIAPHGFVKKTGKTPDKEIDKAEAIRKMYLEFK